MDDYPLLDIIFTMLFFYLFLCWIYLLVALASDIFRSRDLSGGMKALWVLLLVFLPVFGALLYVATRGDGMADRNADQMRQRDEALRSYVRETAGSGGSGGGSVAEELTALARLRDGGTITEAEFEAQKAKLLA